MKAMNPEQQQRWVRVRQRGRSHFVWHTGVLRWGLSTAAMWTLFMTFLFNPLLDRDAPPLPIVFTINLLVGLAIFPIGGWCWGVWVWRISERRYKAGRAHRSAAAMGLDPDA